MSTLSPIQPATPSAGNDRPQTPGVGVLGWLVLTFAIMPVAMAIRGDGQLYTWIGLVMLTLGVGMVLAARIVRRFR
jgi:hypothetical protein